MIVRNNILHVVDSDETSIQDDADGTSGRRNDFDHDLFNGRLYSPLPQEIHGIRGAPLYDTGNGRLEFFLAASGPGVDAGVLLPNFNDDHAGTGPDIGAFERGRPPLSFGAPVEPPLPPQYLSVQSGPLNVSVSRAGRQPRVPRTSIQSGKIFSGANSSALPPGGVGLKSTRFAVAKHPLDGLGHQSFLQGRWHGRRQSLAVRGGDEVAAGSGLDAVGLASRIAPG